ncbi:MAG TPA: hypothetical protein RMH99_10670 [Sandaracinaceae bacterium LLY-WYZ-13_1]|nr:hypothetical protein [Sandaracinaceae bacterium LLY-WYZ-13_1]
MHRPVACLLAVALLAGCETTESPMEMDTPTAVLRPRSEPIEFVGLSVSRPVVSEADFLDVVGPLLGAEAREGTYHAGYELDPGLRISSEADPRTDEQVILTMQMDPADGSEARTILRVPASLEYGEIFVETVRVALARTQEVVASGDTMPDWHLEYHAVSANGGYLMIQLDHRDSEAFLVVTTENPRTSLRSGEINTAAFEGNPHEMIGGTVNFTLSRDEFDFFSSRAYGVSAARDQNFDDFRLQPYDFLRITVTPMLDEEMVDVAFDVVLLDGTRVPFARAPASYVAGEQFRQNVFRLVDNMNAAEREEPGSSRDFRVPFHYDDPMGGGVVRVIAEGRDGQFGIAYAVDSPIHELRDVDFVPYVGDPIGDAPPPPVASSCDDHGSEPADAGALVMRFDASDTVRNSEELTDPLRGTVRGSVYREEDVTIGGPRDGAEAVASFTFEDVDITGGVSEMRYALEAELEAGSYQVLGFMDIDGNGAESGDPDVGDPVTLPIGAIDLECAEQEAVVEFALLLPEGV